MSIGPRTVPLPGSRPAPDLGAERAARSSRSRPSIEFAAALVVAAAGAVISGASPTGIAGWDLALLAISGAAVVWMSRWANSPALVVFALPGVLLGGLSVWSAFGLVALAGAVYCLRERRRHRALGPTVGGLALISALHIGSFGFWGLPTIAVVAAFLPVAVTGWLGLRRGRGKRRTRRVALCLALVVLVSALSTAYTTTRLRSSTSAAISATRSAASAARAGDIDATETHLERAEEGLDDTAGALNSPLTLPARLTPIVAQHLRFADDLITPTTDVATRGRRALTTIDLDSLGPSAGSFDLDQLQSVAAEAREIATSLAGLDRTLATFDDDWLVPPAVDAGARLEKELGERPDLNLIAEGLEVGADLLGASGPRQYLVLLATPAESREHGGFIGAMGVLRMADGGFELVDAAPIQDFYDRTDALDGNDYTDWYRDYNVDRFPQNLTGTPDPHTLLRATRDVFPVLNGRPVDGVLYVDPIGLGALVDAFGSVQVPELDRALTGPEVERFLLRDQYLTFDSRDDRKEFLSVFAQSVMRHVASAPIPDPREIADRMGPAARGGHIELVTTNERTNTVLRQVHLLHDFPPPDDDDFLTVVQTNAAASKLDAYLRRIVEYEVDFDPESGQLSGIARVTFVSSATPDLPEQLTGTAEVGRNNPIEREHRLLAGIFTPHRPGQLVVDGSPGFFRPMAELGYTRILHEIRIPLGGRATVEYHVAGTVRPGDYRLTMANQPLAVDDEVVLRITPSPGWQLGAAPPGGTETVSITLSEDTDIIIRSQRTS